MLTTNQAMGMIETLDIAVFQVNTRSTLSDRTGFLRVQNFARSMLGRRYVYLEVGSDIRGYAKVAKPLCRR
jgi:hypothetical protein